MTATQSSVGPVGSVGNQFDPEVCCTAEKVLDGVYLRTPLATEIQYISEENAGTKTLLIDTKASESIARVSLF